MRERTVSLEYEIGNKKLWKNISELEYKAQKLYEEISEINFKLSSCKETYCVSFELSNKTSSELYKVKYKILNIKQNKFMAISHEETTKYVDINLEMRLIPDKERTRYIKLKKEYYTLMEREDYLDRRKKAIIKERKNLEDD